jgi:hypothetical protein
MLGSRMFDISFIIELNQTVKRYRLRNEIKTELSVELLRVTNR